MPAREWKSRIEDILDAIRDIEQLTEDMTCGTFCADNKTVKAVLYNTAVIGEAARHVPPDFRALHPEISWREMADMRNVVIHEYFGVDLEILWETIQHELPPLKTLLQKILQEAPHSDS
jgi:uncharacterized protein with HEPN domain